MATQDALHYTRIPLTHGSGAIPAAGFGTLVPDPVATRQATQTALEVEFRPLDCAERYRSEDAMQAIRMDITTNVRFNSVVVTGVPGFIPRAGAQ